MSIHKLTAGSGYDYLTRQVAALDATHKGRVGLAAYYTAQGEMPGRWVGSGMAGIDGLDVGDVVTAEQMKALYGLGLHPLAAERDPEAGRLGLPFRVYANDVSPFQIAVARRFTQHNKAAGVAADAAIPEEVRARIRTEVAAEFFHAEHGRPPADPREISGTIAKLTRPKTDAVAGYDLTFSPVKSVSTLWAIADQHTSAVVESAHHAAVADALRFIEQHALYTRTGAQGVRQVDVQGLVAAAFTHRDSRAGDPDLHTHVAVANKVQTLDGRWLSIDGRLLFKATVAAAECYNTALEAHLTHRLGVRFAERPNPDPRKRPIREIVGVDPRLNQRWSTRRAAIEARTGELATRFQADHGRPPTPAETVQLAQRATLETRDAKHEPRSLAEQRATWHAQAAQVLGGDHAIAAMVTGTLHPTRTDVPECSGEWVRAAAGRVLQAMETRRSTWQIWHVHAEALRQVRPLQLAPDQAERAADVLTTEVLGNRSTSLARPSDGVVEPDVLRRRDGSSVYTVAGADLYTSPSVLAAEQRLVVAAGRTGGRTIPDTAVDVALLEMTANGVQLDAGQAGLVRAMATSGARVQLAIAAAGTGKTTAMHALAHAWTSTGGTIVGLAPSAAAAAQLREQIDAPTDTLAKLAWSITHHDLPGWAATIGPGSLVVIDEAGMADTISLDAAVAFVASRGGSVRLIGDDQQLAAVGAGGVLRDIAATHGAVRLTELHRFTDPAEAAATVALRDGRTEALGFYLDHGRIHVGDLTTSADQLYTAWKADRDAGLDALMLAPTRELAAQLNQRARAEHVGRRSAAEAAVDLADGNQASVGDVVITRRNDRRLRTSPTDWVKNGDRWTVHHVHADGGITVQHLHHRWVVRLPADYVTGQVELGYATTVHAAQGVTADTMHGLVTGDEARQQLYTMATRGRTANHLYLQVVGDGDPHSVIRPEHTHPATATDLLEQILARDDAARSATSAHRDLYDPAVRLGDAAARYVDALHTAAHTVAPPDLVARIDAAAEQISAGLTGEPAWPALVGHLLVMHADGLDPIQQLRAAAAVREIDSAYDRAAVLDHRLPEPSRRGPLPWLPAIPRTLGEHPDWGPYLYGRADLISNLASRVRDTTPDTPTWLPSGARPDRPLVEQVAVWRAATGVDPADLRPTGPPQPNRTAAGYQRTLDEQLADGRTPAVAEWGPPIRAAGPSAAQDQFLPVLAGRLAAVNRAGINARHLMATAYAAGPLPDDHGAAALWWRIQPHLQPAVAAGLDQPIATDWTEQLDQLIGPERADSWRRSPAWPALVAVVEENLHRGNTLNQLLASAAATAKVGDECQQWVWRLSLLLDLIPEHPEDREPVHDLAPADLQIGVPVRPHETHAAPAPAATLAKLDRRTPEPDPADTDRRRVDADLAVLALTRRGLVEPSDQDVRRMLDRRDAWHVSPVTRDRLLDVNRQALEFYRAQYTPQCWSRAYLAERLGVDIADDARFLPGHATDSWTALTAHLRQLGITDEEMELAGVVSRTRDGRIVDRFRNRLILPIVHNTEILGFVARRHPGLGDNDAYAGPKYLNTPATLLYSKGAQLYGPVTDSAPGAVPVLVEGPLDAIATTLAGSDRHAGYAPLGTSLTSEQASQIAQFGHPAPIVATDHDIPGQVAAERAYWQLTLHGLDPLHATWQPGSDPAETLHSHGAAGVTAALHAAQPLAATLIDERLRNLPADQAATAAIDVLAARPGRTWTDGVTGIARRTGVDEQRLRAELHSQARQWVHDPRRAADQQLSELQQTKARLTTVVNADRWRDLADRTDPRLTQQSDWGALAEMMQTADRQGLDVPATVAQLTQSEPLNRRPAQDLRYRLASLIDPQALDASANPDVANRDGPTKRPSSSHQARTRRLRDAEQFAQVRMRPRGGPTR